jgi:hypothetical protein
MTETPRNGMPLKNTHPAHNRLGMSPGEIYNSIECSICGDHPQDCAHIKGRTYGDE